ncbi:MAG: sporulation integral membrane protein YtvI [Ruminococcaceae bacterium]|nr:sporulation integral membrane protein YtvI [Oscillospiraceae bacterium]
MYRIDWKRTAAILITLTGALLILYVLCSHVFGLLLPFLLAFLLAVLTRPLIIRFARRTGCPPRVGAMLVTLAVLVVLGLLCYFLCHRLLLEVQRLIQFLIDDIGDENGKVAHLIAFFRGIGERLPLLSELHEVELIRDLIGDPQEYLIAQLQNALSRMASELAGAAGELLRRLPGVLLFLLVTVIACFYFAVEYETMTVAIKRCFPQKIAEKLPEWKRRALAVGRRCLKAYFWLFLLTLGELTLGFLLLRVEYPFLLALLAAALDILPVFGVGTVLLPWALFCLLTGGILRGVGILVLYAVITVVRQIAEPHFVGKSIGLHPILMLIAFYVGIRLFGVAGILLGPLCAFVIKAIFDYTRGNEARSCKKLP